MTTGPGGELFGKLRELGLPVGHYAIFGSGPLAVRSLIPELRDLDVVARGVAWERASALGSVCVAPEGDSVVRFQDSAIEVFGG